MVTDETARDILIACRELFPDGTLLDAFSGACHKMLITHAEREAVVRGMPFSGGGKSWSEVGIEWESVFKRMARKEVPLQPAAVPA